MKRLINNGDIFDKYVSFEDKKFREDTIKQLNWQGHRNIAGTYKGAAYTTSLADNYMANNLRNDSNPKGSLLQAAKNYTDEKVATIGGGGSTRHVYNVFLDYHCYYTIYTTKDYKLPIGQYQEAADFRTNAKYDELRPYSGAFPANGYYYKQDNGTKWIVYSASISGPSSSYYISGYNLTSGGDGSASISVKNYGIKQLF